MKTILVVDDAKTMRSLAQFALTKAGYKVLEGGDGLEGLKVLGANQVDLIISDVNMPNLNGLEMVQQVKANESWKNIPIFMLTTESSEEVSLKGKALGVKAWIVKPFNPDSLLAAVKRVLG